MILRLVLMIAFVGMTLPPSHSANAAPPVGLQRLNSIEIRKALEGKAIGYSPPRLADAGVHEEFHRGGIWRGIRYSRGPIPFTGKWMVRNNNLCVLEDAKRSGQKLRTPHWLCRAVWRDLKSETLQLKHLSPNFLGLMEVVVRPLKERF